MKKHEIINYKDKNLLTFLQKIIQENIIIISQNIYEKLLPRRNANTYLLNPYQFRNFINKELNKFLNFLETKNYKVSKSRGEQAAIKGLDIVNILSYFNILQDFFLEYINNANISLKEFVLKIITQYKDSYLLSFIKQKFILIYKEQEQLYQSLISTVTKQKEDIANKEKQLQENKFKALEIQNQQRLDFLINFAHETKLPLSIILNTIKMVKDEAGRRKLQSLPALENEIKELMNMVGDILDNEKIIQGKMLYEHNIILNITIAVKSKIELFKNITDKMNIQVVPEMQQDLYIKIAPHALDRILNNIFDNAIKYNLPSEGRIYVTLKDDNGFIILTIRDTGIGIPSDQLNHIFKPYYQSGYKKRNIQGIGAGLPLVKSILNEIHANIVIESKLQKGTTVTIKFKKEIIKGNTKDLIIEKVTLSKPVNKRNISLKQENYNNNHKTIFIVEDNIELLTFMQNHMDGIFNFYYARDGQEALRKLKIMPKPDVIIADIMMDIMDGYEFFYKLREIEEMQDIPFIFLTAKTMEKDKLKGLQMGAIDFIVKPFSVEVLKEKIKSIIRDHEIYSEKETEKMEKKIIKAIRTRESDQLNYELLYKKYNLSQREQEIVHYVVQGWTNKDIADKLNISPDTVKVHITNIKKKCLVKNRVQLSNLFCK